MKKQKWIVTLLLSLAVAGQIFAQQPVTTSTFTYNGLPLPIFTDGADVITIATITVPSAIKMSKVTAQVRIQYPESGDLKVYLFSPEGTRTILLDHDCSVQNVDTTFDDSAQAEWREFCPVEAGRGPFRADQPLSNFNSDGSSFGLWRLFVENDRGDNRSGWITDFSLAITGTRQIGPTTNAQVIVNSASFGGRGIVAPGQLISIFGLGIGPAVGVTAPKGSLPTSLGGTTVTINGAAAPIAYSSLYRVDVQAPFSLTTGSTATVQVAYNNQTSSPVSLSVNSAAPGLFTLGAGGQGQVKATNQDGSINSVLTPAPKGSVISVYVSGLGSVSPSIVAGAVTPFNPLSYVNNGAGALIGGVPATVWFAGLAPGLVGWYQLNIEVPATARSGKQELRIYANSNGSWSQEGATIEVQ